MKQSDLTINFNDLILITGANGFIGSKVVETLLAYGFRNLRCFVRPSSDLTKLNKTINSFPLANIEMVYGNLLLRNDCQIASKGVAIIFHVAAGIEKTFPGCFMNSVMTTQNLLESILQNKTFKRFLNVSSFRCIFKHENKAWWAS